MISLRVYTKSFSPEAVAAYEYDSVNLSVKYCQPSAKGRAIFGEVIPYGEVWRTGANEATIFNNNAALQIGGQPLAAGSYSLFTVPDKDEWQVIFNKETGQWGVDPMKGGAANRDPELDVLTITVPTIYTKDFFETFTIAMEGIGNEIELVMMWENTMIVVPMAVSSL
jgi:hypothetical protein